MIFQQFQCKFGTIFKCGLVHKTINLRNYKISPKNLAFSIKKFKNKIQLLEQILKPCQK